MHSETQRFPRHLQTALLLLLAGVCLPGCTGDSAEDGPRQAPRVVPAVEAVQSRQGNLPLIERLSGVVRANNQVEIYPEISAAVERVYVENGDEVARGQALIELRDREFQQRVRQARAGLEITEAQVRQAQAELRQTRADWERTRSLADQGLVSSTELEDAQTDVASAEADLDLARARVAQAQATLEEREEELALTVVRAPIDGTVGNRHAEVGMLVSAGTRLFTIGQLDSVTVEIILTDRMLDYIEPGMRAQILSGSLPRGSAEAHLTRISPFLHPVTHSTRAEIDLPNPNRRLRAGMFVPVDVHYGQSEQATLVPLSALYEDPATGATGVYVASEHLEGEPVATSGSEGTIALTEPVTFELAPVEVVAKGRLHAGIRGVADGRWVVTIGQDLLSGNDGLARVRRRGWAWAEQMQRLQREDLLEKVITRQRDAGRDSVAVG